MGAEPSSFEAQIGKTDTTPIVTSADIHRKTYFQKIPFRAILELTHRCNFDCVHCFISNKRGHGELGTEEWKSVLDQLAELGCLEVTLTGGEALARPDFFEIAEHARARRFMIRLFSNGARITSEVARKIRALAVCEVDISLYGAREETYAQVTGRPGQYARVIKGIRALLEAGTFVYIKIPVIRQTHEELDDMANLARELGVKFKADAKIDARDDHDRSTIHACQVDAIEDLPNFIESYGPKNHGPHRRDPDKPVCNAGWNNLAITPQGSVLPCVQYRRSIGSVRDAPLAALWHDSDEIRKIRALRFRDFKTCATACAISEHCAICPGKFYADNDGDELKHSPYFCDEAALKKEKWEAQQSGRTWRGTPPSGNEPCQSPKEVAKRALALAERERADRGHRTSDDRKSLERVASASRETDAGAPPPGR